MARTIYTQDTRDRNEKRKLEYKTRRYQVDAEQFTGFEPQGGVLPDFNDRVGIAARLRPDLKEKDLRELERKRADSFSLGTEFQEYLPVRRARGAAVAGVTDADRDAERQSKEAQKRQEQFVKAQDRDAGIVERVGERIVDKEERLKLEQEREALKSEREQEKKLKEFETGKKTAEKDAWEGYFNKKLKDVLPEYQAYQSKRGELTRQISAIKDNPDMYGDKVELERQLVELDESNAEINNTFKGVTADKSAFKSYLDATNGNLLEAANLREKQLIGLGVDPEQDELIQSARDTARRWMSPEARESAKMFDAANVYASLDPGAREAQDATLFGKAQESAKLYQDELSSISAGLGAARIRFDEGLNALRERGFTGTGSSAYVAESNKLVDNLYKEYGELRKREKAAQELAAQAKLYENQVRINRRVAEVADTTKKIEDAGKVVGTLFNVGSSRVKDADGREYELETPDGFNEKLKGFETRAKSLSDAVKEVKSIPYTVNEAPEMSERRKEVMQQAADLKKEASAYAKYRESQLEGLKEGVKVADKMRDIPMDTSQGVEKREKIRTSLGKKIYDESVAIADEHSAINKNADKLVEEVNRLQSVIAANPADLDSRKELVKRGKELMTLADKQDEVFARQGRVIGMNQALTVASQREDSMIRGMAEQLVSEQKKVYTEENTGMGLARSAATPEIDPATGEVAARSSWDVIGRTLEGVAGAAVNAITDMTKFLDFSGKVGAYGEKKNAERLNDEVRKDLAERAKQNEKIKAVADDIAATRQEDFFWNNPDTNFAKKIEFNDAGAALQVANPNAFVTSDGQPVIRQKSLVPTVEGDWSPDRWQNDLKDAFLNMVAKRDGVPLSQATVKESDRELFKQYAAQWEKVATETQNSYVKHMLDNAEVNQWIEEKGLEKNLDGVMEFMRSDVGAGANIEEFVQSVGVTAVDTLAAAAGMTASAFEMLMRWDGNLEQTLGYRAYSATSDYLRNEYLDPRLEGGVASTAGSLIGSQLGFMGGGALITKTTRSIAREAIQSGIRAAGKDIAGGAVTKGLSRRLALMDGGDLSVNALRSIGVTSTAYMGGSMGYMNAYKSAEEMGWDDRTRKEYAMMHGILGLSEALPMGKFIDDIFSKKMKSMGIINDAGKRVDVSIPDGRFYFMQRMNRLVENTVEEMAQEGFAGIAGNAIDQRYIDPFTKLFDDFALEAGAGGAMGFVTSFLLTGLQQRRAKRQFQAVSREVYKMNEHFNVVNDNSAAVWNSEDGKMLRELGMLNSQSVIEGETNKLIEDAVIRGSESLYGVKAEDAKNLTRDQKIAAIREGAKLAGIELKDGEMMKAEGLLLLDSLIKTVGRSSDSMLKLDAMNRVHGLMIAKAEATMGKVQLFQAGKAAVAEINAMPDIDPAQVDPEGKFPNLAPDLNRRAVSAMIKAQNGIELTADEQGAIDGFSKLYLSGSPEGGKAVDSLGLVTDKALEVVGGMAPQSAGLLAILQIQRIRAMSAEAGEKVSAQYGVGGDIDKILASLTEEEKAEMAAIDEIESMAQEQKAQAGGFEVSFKDSSGVTRKGFVKMGQRISAQQNVTDAASAKKYATQNTKEFGAVSGAIRGDVTVAEIKAEAPKAKAPKAAPTGVVKASDVLTAVRSGIGEAAFKANPQAAMEVAKLLTVRLNRAAKSLDALVQASGGISVQTESDGYLLYDQKTKKIVIDPKKMSKIAAQLLENPERIDTLIQEEVIHFLAISNKDLNDKAAEIYRALPENLKEAVRASYKGGAKDKFSHDYEGGHEFIRMLIQGKINANQLTSEGTLPKSLLQKVADFIAAIRDVILNTAKSLMDMGVDAEMATFIEAKADELALMYNDIMAGVVAPAPAQQQEAQAQPAPAAQPSQQQTAPAGGDVNPVVKVVTPVANGMEVEVIYDVIELEDLRGMVQAQVSEKQTRDRQSGISQKQVQAIASDPDSRKLVESNRTDEGAPMIRENAVLSGNGRAMGILLGFDSFSDSKGWTEYRNQVNARIAKYGLTEKAKGMKNPVLVRRITNLADDQVSQFVKESNTSDILQETDAEQGLLDFDVVEPMLHELEFNTDGAVTKASLDRIAKAFEDTNRPVKLDKDGLYQESDLRKRVLRAAMAGLFRAADVNNPKLLGEFIEADGYKRLFDAFMSRAGKLARMPKSLSLADVFIDALAKRDDNLNEIDMFNEANPVTLRIAKYFKDNKTKPTAIRAFLDNFLTEVEYEYNQQQIESQYEGGDLFSGIAPRPTFSGESAIEGAIAAEKVARDSRQAAGQDGEAGVLRAGGDQLGLFDLPNRGAELTEKDLYAGIQPRGQLDLFSFNPSVTKSTADAAKELVESSKVADEEQQTQDIPVTQDSTKEIKDFGEKIGGARKDLYQRMDDARKLNIADSNLSQVFPEPDYNKLLSQGVDPRVVAFVHAARDEIPAKPRVSYKLDRWAKQVEVLRDMSFELLGGTVDFEPFRQKLEGAGRMIRSDILGRSDLYMAVGHDISLRGLSFDKHNYRKYKEIENSNVWVVGKSVLNKPDVRFQRFHDLGYGVTKEDALSKFIAIIDGIKAEGQTGGRKIKFDVYSYRQKDKQGFYIGKNMSGGYVDLFKFDTAQEARDYLRNNYDDILSRYESFTDIGQERRDSNAPRVGENYRKGRNATPETFSKAFGFRGVEFGNYVEQDRRQEDLNNAYDALLDLASILNIPTRAISLNGTLGLAFGARGKGGKGAASAHFEPNSIVINLTKNKGPGSLAHEWFHALDNYFARQANVSGEFLTDMSLADVKKGAGIREEVGQAFVNVINAINKTQIAQRSAELDKKRTGKPYWATKIEMAARTFENYVIHRLLANNASNDYLANVSDVSEYADSLIRSFFESGKTAVDSYPYLTEDEISGVAGAFDNLFNTLKVKETEEGQMKLYAGGDVTELSRDLQDKYEGLKTLFLSESNDVISIDMIEVDKGARKQGIGTSVIRDIVDYADKNNKEISLVPALKDDYKGTTSRGRLIDFYKRFGFVENKGRNKDFSKKSGSMYRIPRGQALFAGGDTDWQRRNELGQKENLTAAEGRELDMLDKKLGQEFMSFFDDGAAAVRVTVDDDARPVDADGEQMTLFAGGAVTTEMDRAYMDAVQSGDMETAQRLVDEAARKAGYDSPKVYHGGKFNKNIDPVFKINEGSPRKSNWQLLFGVHFAENKDEANAYVKGKTGTVTEAYLNTQNILDISDRQTSEGQWKLAFAPLDLTNRLISVGGKFGKEMSSVLSIWQKGLPSEMDSVKGRIGWAGIAQALDNMPPNVAKQGLESLGFEAVKYTAKAQLGGDPKYRNERPFSAYIILSPEKIKSADPVTYDADGNPIPLSERFNEQSDSILYAGGAIDPELAQGVYDSLVNRPEVWKYGIETPTSKDLGEVLNEYGKAAGVSFAVRKAKNADVYLIRNNESGDVATVGLSDGRFDIDAMEVTSKERIDGGGSLLYQGILTWAANNGYKDSGLTLTRINLVRKTANMLSSSLRHGTTKHLLPSFGQKVEWEDGNDVANIASLAYRDAQNTLNAIPELKSYEYRDGKYYKDGVEVTERDVIKAVQRYRANGGEGFGRGSALRALFVMSEIQAKQGGVADSGKAAGRAASSLPVDSILYAGGDTDYLKLEIDYANELERRLGDALTVNQRKASYGDKRQLLLDFSKSLSGDDVVGGKVPNAVSSVSTSEGLLRNVGTPSTLRELAKVRREKLNKTLKLEIIGETVKSHADLASLAQVVRNPLFETFYLVGVDDSNKVTGVYATTSRVPFASTVLAKGDTSDTLRNILDYSGATSYYLLHNHPSGDVTPSSADYRITAQIQDIIGKRFLGHVVINHGKYSYFKSPYDYVELEIPTTDKVDPMAADFSELPNVLGQAVDSKGKVAVLAKQIEAAKSSPELLTGFVVSRKMKILSAFEVHESDLNDENITYFRDMVRNLGGQNFIVYAEHDDVRSIMNQYNRIAPYFKEHFAVHDYIAFDKSNNNLFSSVDRIGRSDDVERGMFVGERYKGERIQPEKLFAGGDTRLLSEQYERHAELEAKHNDGTITESERAEAKSLVDEAARKAGYDSPKVYHGYRGEQFNVFDNTIGDRRSSAPDNAHFFASTPEGAFSYSGDRSKIIPAYLKLTNPLEEDFRGADWQGDLYGKIEAYNPDSGESEIFDTQDEAFDWLESEGIAGDYSEYIRTDPFVGMSTNSAAREAQKYGHDGVIIENVIDYGSHFDGNPLTVYVAFKSSQIKSADPFTGVPLDQRFDTASDSILRAGGQFDPDAPESKKIDDLMEQIGQWSDPEQMARLRELAAQENEWSKTIGDPRLANISGDEAVRRGIDVVDYARAERMQRETFAMWEESADRLLQDREGVTRQLLETAYNGEAISTPEMVLAAQVVAEEMMAKAIRTGDKKLREQAETIVYAYRHARGMAARVLASGRDRFKTPEQRHREFLMTVLFRPLGKENNIIRDLVSPAKQTRTIDRLRGQVRELMAKANVNEALAQVGNGQLAQRISGLEQMVEGGTMLLQKAEARIKELENTNEMAASVERAKAEKLEASLLDVKAKLDAALDQAAKVIPNSADKQEIARLLNEIGKTKKDLVRITQVFNQRDARLKELEAKFAKMGITFDHIMNDEVTLSLEAKNIIARVAGAVGLSKDEFRVITMLTKGHTLPYVAERVGMGVDAARDVFKRYHAQLLDYYATYGIEALNPELLSLKAGGYINQGGFKNATPEKQKAILEMVKAMGLEDADWRYAKNGVKPSTESRRKRAEAKKQRGESIKKGAKPTWTMDASGRYRMADKFYDKEFLQKAFDELDAEPAAYDGSDPIQVKQVARMAMKFAGTPSDMLYEWYINSILSAPITQSRNIIGNALNSAYGMTAKRLIEAMINEALLAVGAGNVRAARIGEFREMARALIPAVSGAFDYAKDAWITDDNNYLNAMLNQQSELYYDDKRGGSTRKAIPGKLGEVVRVPGRALLTADEFSLAMTSRIEVAAYAYRLGKAEGLKGEDLQKYIDGQVNIPASPSWIYAAERALEYSFREKRDKPGTFSAWAMGFAQKVREVPIVGIIAKMHIPFVTTPFNIYAQGLRQTPLGAISLVTKLSVAAGKGGASPRMIVDAYGDRGGAELIRDITEQFIAFAATAFMWGMFPGDDDDMDKPILLTGDNGWKGSESRADMRLGMPPYSIRFKIGDKVVVRSFGGVEPFATIIGTTASGVQNIKEGLKGDQGAARSVMNGFFAAAASIGAQAQDKTFLQGVSNAIKLYDDIVNGSERSVERYTANMLASFVPNIIRNPSRNIQDSYPVAGADFVETLKFSAMPWLAKDAKFDPYGNMIMRPDTAAERMIKPWETRELVPNKYDRMFKNWENKIKREGLDEKPWYPGDPSRSVVNPVTKKPVYLSTKDYSEYMRISGETADRLLDRAKFSIDDPSKSDIERAQTAFEIGRKAAREKLFTKNSEWIQKTK